MQHNVHKSQSKYYADSCSSNCFSGASATGISRRNFLGGLAAVAAMSRLIVTEASQAGDVSRKPVSSGKALPAGAALRIKPVLTYKDDSQYIDAYNEFYDKLLS